MKKLFICFIALIGLFLYRNVYAEVDGPNQTSDELYIYYTEPVVGEKPNNIVKLRKEPSDGLLYDSVEVTWFQCVDYLDCNRTNSIPFDIFEDGKYYSFYSNYNVFDYDYLFRGFTYYNDVLLQEPYYLNHSNKAVFKALPGRKLDNNSTGLVKITDISLDSKSATVVITEAPSYKDLNVSFGLDFIKVDDYAKYKVTVRNDDNVDYTLKSSSMFSESGYVRYDLDLEGDSNIIKANSEKTLNVTISYMKEVPDEMLESGVYTESNKAKLVFVNDNSIINPNTGNKIIFIVGLLVIVIGSLFVKFNNKEIKTMIFIVTGILMLIPISGKALNEINIDIDANIKIQRVLEFCTVDAKFGCTSSVTYSNLKKYYFTPGMTVNDVVYNTYRNINSSGVYINPGHNGDKYNFVVDISAKYRDDINNIEVNGTDLIKDSSEGCYIAVDTTGSIFC